MTVYGANSWLIVAGDQVGVNSLVMMLSELSLGMGRQELQS